MARAASRRINFRFGRAKVLARKVEASLEDSGWRRALVPDSRGRPHFRLHTAARLGNCVRDRSTHRQGALAAVVSCSLQHQLCSRETWRRPEIHAGVRHGQALHFWHQRNSHVLECRYRHHPLAEGVLQALPRNLAVVWHRDVTAGRQRPGHHSLWRQQPWSTHRVRCRIRRREVAMGW